MSSISSRWLGALFGFALALAPVACQTDADARAALAELGASCLINSDCKEALICAFQLCHQACSNSRDCSHGARCVEGRGGNNVCQLDEERNCSTSKACPGSEACGIDGECRDRCRAASDCVDEQVCTGGTCAEAAELGPSGALTAADSRPPSLPCGYDSDCPEKQLCRAGSCRAECSVDADCPTGQACSDETCTAPATGCVLDSDCSQDEQCSAGACQKLPKAPLPECSATLACTRVGQHCEAGRCRCECSSDDECARGQACEDECVCVPSAVLYGDVVVADSTQLAALQNVVEITGHLEITISGASSGLHLPNLRSVGSLYVSPTHGGPLEVTFDALETGGTLRCTTICHFPKLDHADSLNLNAEGRLELPLSSAGSVTIYGQKLTELSLPLLNKVETLALSALPELTKVSLPLLKSASYVTISELPQLTELDLHSLEVAYLSFVISKTGLTDLDGLSGLTKGGEGIAITDNPALSICLVNQLEEQLRANGWVLIMGKSGNYEPPGGC